MLTNNAKITSYGMDKNEENQLNQLNKFFTQASSKLRVGTLLDPGYATNLRLGMAMRLYLPMHYANIRAWPSLFETPSFNWFRFETPSTLLQEHFWDCKQLGSYCAEDPLQSNKSEATFKTCFRWNLFEESLFWTEITGNCFLDWRSRRKIGRWTK